jgi:hypothetical protein
MKKIVFQTLLIAAIIGASLGQVYAQQPIPPVCGTSVSDCSSYYMAQCMNANGLCVANSNCPAPQCQCECGPQNSRKEMHSHIQNPEQTTN